MDKYLVSIIICTRNRYDLVLRCLKSIDKQTNENNRKLFEVLLIDNRSTDKTKSLNTKGFNFNYRYIKESKIGLSIARNTGIINAKSKYLIYIDDDAYLSSNYIDSTCSFLKKNKDKNIVFGGPYKRYFIKKPGKWFPSSYGTWNLGNKFITDINPKDHLFTGLNIGFSKHVFMDIGYFDTGLGMVGNKLGYGEETNLQYKAYEIGSKFIYIPSMLVYHLVANYKLSLHWLLCAAFVSGKQASKTFNSYNSLIKRIYMFLKEVVYSIYLSFRNINKPIKTNIYLSWKGCIFLFGYIFSK